VWWSSGFEDTAVYEMTELRNGHELEGPAIIEAESTTFAIPPDRRTALDEHGIFHLETKRESN
jgi:N-methylhydantoinase A/oxoprolinase/acetone carboxylase beta subunit